jgi:uncharacterized damage-inducible protein DinB
VNIQQLIERYLAGPAILRRSVEGVSPADFDAVPIASTWSIRQVVCHVADSEILYADRMKRIVAEDEPPLMQAEPEQFLAALAVSSRPIETELRLVELLREHVGQILCALPADCFRRRGIHSTDGPMTLEAALLRAVTHLPHHVAFIDAKRRALAAGNR